MWVISRRSSTANGVVRSPAKTNQVVALCQLSIQRKWRSVRSKRTSKLKLTCRKVRCLCCNDLSLTFHSGSGRTYAQLKQHKFRPNFESILQCCICDALPEDNVGGCIDLDWDTKTINEMDRFLRQLFDVNYEMIWPKRFPIAKCLVLKSLITDPTKVSLPGPRRPRRRDRQRECHTEKTDVEWLRVTLPFKGSK